LWLVTSDRAVMVMLAPQGFTLEINRITAPWIMQSFHLSRSGALCLDLSFFGRRAGPVPLVRSDLIAAGHRDCA